MNARLHWLTSLCCLVMPLAIQAQDASAASPVTGSQYASIDEAIARGDAADVRARLAIDPGSANQGKHPSMSPLQQAILRQQSDIAVLLIKAGADINRKDTSGRTPLHLAVERKDLATTQALMEHQALPDERDRVGWTPLHHAAAKDQVEIARALITGGADPMTLSAGGGTPLHEAAASGGSAMVKLLLENGVDPSIVSKTGATALSIAGERQNKAAMALLQPLTSTTKKNTMNPSNKTKTSAALVLTSLLSANAADWKPSFSDASVPKDKQEMINAAMPNQAIVPAKAPRRVLVFSATAGFRHGSIPYGKIALQTLGEKTGAYQAVVSDDPANFETEALQQFDAVILLSPTQDFFMPDRKQRETFTKEELNALQDRHNRLTDNLVNYVKGGGGLMGIHAATDSCYQHAEYGQTIGGYFNGHPWHANNHVTIVVEDGDHGTMKPVFGDMADFPLVDEIYQFRDAPYSRSKLRVLLHVDPERSDTVKGLKREDNDYAVAWVQQVGRGRVFYSSIGHNNHIYWNPLMLKHYLAGIQFATGDLSADTTPSAQRP